MTEECWMASVCLNVYVYTCSLLGRKFREACKWQQERLFSPFRAMRSRTLQNTKPQIQDGHIASLNLLRSAISSSLLHSTWFGRLWMTLRRVIRGNALLAGEQQACPIQAVWETALGWMRERSSERSTAVSLMPHAKEGSLLPGNSKKLHQVPLSQGPKWSAIKKKLKKSV